MSDTAMACVSSTSSAKGTCVSRTQQAQVRYRSRRAKHSRVEHGSGWGAGAGVRAGRRGTCNYKVVAPGSSAAGRRESPSALVLALPGRNAT